MNRKQQFETYTVNVTVNVTEVVDYEEKGETALMNQQPSAIEHRVPQIMSEFVWKKNEYALEHSNQPEDIRRVMIIYSGGTLGMKWSDDNGYQPVPHYLEAKMKTYPMFHDTGFTIPEEETNAFEPFKPLALPVTFHKYRILYCINEYNPLLDSCNMNMDDWAKLAKDIYQYYNSFDAFVILHGTDTVCYTASALSFMLENLGKPVILTGAQVPLSELRSDARDNLLEALIMAGSGQRNIPEVCLYFNNKLFRGNRCTKMHSASFDAFESPNLPPLATVGIDISVNTNLVSRTSSREKLKVHTTMCRDVGILRVFPGITPTALGAFLQPPMKGVVLQTFGAGNLPAQQPLLTKLKEACDRGVVVVNCTQCATGNVTTSYPAARALCELGVVSGADMTVEAALTKLSYLLGREDLDLAAVREYMGRDMCGELTLKEPKNDQLILDLSVLREALPCMMCAAAAKGDNEELFTLMQKGGDVDQPNYDGRTPLHLAASEGHVETVKFLIHHGASVNKQDRFHHTALHDAAQFRRHKVIKVLLAKGASILLPEFKSENASKVIQLAAEDDVDGLLAWQEAGVDLQACYNGLSPLDAAQRSNASNSEQFLKRNSI